MSFCIDLLYIYPTIHPDWVPKFGSFDLVGCYFFDWVDFRHAPCGTKPFEQYLLDIIYSNAYGSINRNPTLTCEPIQTIYWQTVNITYSAHHLNLVLLTHSPTSVIVPCKVTLFSKQECFQYVTKSRSLYHLVNLCCRLGWNCPYLGCSAHLFLCIIGHVEIFSNLTFVNILS